MRHRHIALAVCVSAIWGVNFVVTRVGLDSMSPLLFSALRFTVAAVPAVFLVGRPHARWRWVIAVGLALGVVKFSLLYAGMDAGLPAGLSALVLQSQAVFTLAFAAALLGDRPGRRQLVGVGLSVAGIALIASRLGLDRPAHAFALVLAAGAAWGIANVTIRASGAQAGAEGALNFIVWVSAVAAPIMIGLTVTVDGPVAVARMLGDLDLTAFGTVAYVAWLSTLIGFGAWGMLIHAYGASTVAPFAALAPVFAIASSALLLGERVTVFDVIGGVAVTVGVLVVAGGSARPVVREEVASGSGRMPL